MYGVRCTNCGSEHSRVIDSRPVDGGLRRRRLCQCGNRYTSYELAADAELIKHQRKRRSGKLDLAELVRRPEPKEGANFKVVSRKVEPNQACPVCGLRRWRRVQSRLWECTCGLTVEVSE